MHQTVLVTGGAGFIGSNFVRLLLETRPGLRIINLDCLSYSGNLDNLEGLPADRHRFVHGDITDPVLVNRLIRECDAVVHFAAESHVDRSICDAGPFIRSNVVGTQVLLDALLSAKRDGLNRRFVHVSTDEVYGSLPLERPDLSFSETSPLDPKSPYAASKACSDLLCLAYEHTHKLDILVTRCSNNHGPRQFPEKVIPLFVTNLMRGIPVPLYGDGLNVRDWLHVDDHGTAVLAVLERGRTGEVYNVGGSNERSNLELTKSILALMGKDESMIKHVPDRLGHDRRYSVNSTKLQNELGWRPVKSAWPVALESTIRWYHDNRTWWERVLSGAYRRS